MEENKMATRGLDRLSRSDSAAWGGLFALGVLWSVAGFLCLAATGLASLAAVYYVGALMAMAGLFGIAWGFKGVGAGAVILGILSLVVGVLLFIHPGTGLLSLTLLLIGYFWIAGLFRTVTSLFERYEGWGFDFAYGVCAIAVGAIAARAWPVSSFWLLGVLVGAELVVRGMFMMGTAVSARRVIRGLQA
jgi:uncharacterized membrane protein HdeD (DUF308 family)